MLLYCCSRTRSSRGSPCLCCAAYGNPPHTRAIHLPQYLLSSTTIVISFLSAHPSHTRRTWYVRSMFPTKRGRQLKCHGSSRGMAERLDGGVRGHESCGTTWILSRLLAIRAYVPFVCGFELNWHTMEWLKKGIYTVLYYVVFVGGKKAENDYKKNIHRSLVLRFFMCQEWWGTVIMHSMCCTRCAIRREWAPSFWVVCGVCAIMCRILCFVLFVCRVRANVVLNYSL